RVSAAECEIFNQLDDARQSKATEAHEFQYRYRENLKVKPPPPTIPPLSSSEHLALSFMTQDDKTNPFHRLKRYESHLQRSLLLCTKELRTLQKYREAHPRTYEEEPPTTNHQPQTTNKVQNEPILPPTSENQAGTTNNKPQTTNEVQNEPISPLTPPPTTPCDHPPLTPSNPSYSIPDSPKNQEFSCPTP
ncbi:MAG TPA: hypothetical protein VGQ99_00750, partial [Tepidisphaeraceae bacterium]|nr:hypothetical protein [Tepidisphaeraceae bacterium]